MDMLYEFPIERTKIPKQKPANDTPLGFGCYFTDHMFLMDYKSGCGWHNPRIVPYAPLSMDPAAMCLHYGQEVFEGMKAYRMPDGGAALFRPEENMRRLNASNRRMCIPEINEGMAVDAVRQLVRLDEDWIPDTPGTSLYIRPFIIATEPRIGVHPAEQLLFIIILSPVGAYYPEGLQPVRIYVERQYVRTVRGGTGEAKTAANYAASLKAQEEAQALGFSQVLWLDGVERKYIEEVGTMNVFFHIGDTVVTPALEGSVLSGITRKSAIRLLESWGIAVEERRLSLREVIDAHAAGQLREAFGTGTAAVVSPIGELCAGDEALVVGARRIGPLAARLYDTLTGIQTGRVSDPFGWVVTV